MVSRSRIMGLARFLGAILLLTALSAPVRAFSASVTLAWTPSVDPNIAGCNLYYGVASRIYTNMVNPGNATSVTISGLVEGTTYFFAATSYNTLGMESDFSDEASYTVPGVLVPVVNILRTLLNGQVVLGVTGQVGHTYQIQASRLLAGWVTLGVVTVGATGATEFIDVNGSILPALAYRLVEVFPSKLKLLRLPTKQVVLTVTGQVGSTYNIQASPDCITWTVIGTVLVPAGGSLDFTDTNAASFPKRFYRTQYIVPGTIPGALAKLQIHVAPTRQFILTVTGQVGRTYNIQASPDFITWTVIGTALVPAGGSVDFTDTNAASFPKRFYRAQ